MDWLNFVRVGIVMIASSLAVGLALFLMEKYALKPRKDTTIVRPPFIIYLIVGVVDLGLCVLTAYLSIMQNKMYLFIPLTPILLLSLWLIFRGIFWKITIEEDGIVFRNTFGKKRKYLYSEITGIIDGKKGFSIRIGNKRIGVDMYNSNYSELRSILRKNCENELTHQRIVSKLSRKKRKQQKKQG